MKKILMCIFLIGLFAFSCTSPPDYGPKQTNSKIEFAQSVDLVQAPVIFTVNEIALPAPDNPVIQKWIVVCYMETAIASLLDNHEASVPFETSKCISAMARHVNYNQLVCYLPDKSMDRGKLSIRDKL